ncbi:GNAT family N-acetyltransferase [Desulfovibrio ferrophilus]|uniref:Acetyltransferase n=1 Tax=Desulfovibrio ferrophilus TaxID=241368 RepID=A0A2Z6AXV7_9BACT|nr:GNAT family N-acetyltransferase [Desulfovibrio ferrophilus]BBD08087.1 acetyltransferase [Desulfovibrio ferrophilus]
MDSDTAVIDLGLRDEVCWEDVETVRVLTDSSGFFTPKEVEIAMSLVVERLEHGPGCGYHFLFAQGPDSCLGFACYGPFENRSDWHDLYWIAVRGSQRSQGVGSRLLAEVELRVCASGGVWLRVETSSQPRYEPTRNFYERKGFLLTRVDIDHYAKDDDRCIYDKRLGALCDDAGNKGTILQQ